MSRELDRIASAAHDIRRSCTLRLLERPGPGMRPLEREEIVAEDLAKLAALVAELADTVRRQKRLDE